MFRLVGIDKSTGYKRIYKPKHPNAKKSDGKIYEHRYIMSEYLGRPLNENEIVHHINHIRVDNRIENLEIIESTSKHSLHHSKENQELIRQRKCIKCKSSTTSSGFKNGKYKYYRWYKFGTDWICHYCRKKIKE